MFGFGKERPSIVKKEEKEGGEKTILQKLRNLKFAIPAAMATFLASCEGDDSRILAGDDVRKEAFEKEKTLPRISQENISLVKESYEDLMRKIGGTEDNFFRWGDYKSAVIAEDDNVRIYEDLENLTYDQLKNNPPSEAEKVGLSEDKVIWQEEKRQEGREYKKDVSEWVGDEQTGHLEERDSVTVVVPDKVWRETRQAYMESKPSSTYEISFDEDEHTITLTWGNLAYRSLDRGPWSDLSFAKDRESSLFSNGPLFVEELGRMSVDSETGGIIYFYDTENSSTAFHMREDGVMELGSDTNGPEVAREFFEMKVRDFERAQKEITERLR